MHGIFKATEADSTECVMDLHDRIVPVIVVAKATEFNICMPLQFTRKRDLYYCWECRVLCCSGEYLMIPPPYDYCTHSEVIRFDPKDFDITNVHQNPRT